MQNTQLDSREFSPLFWPYDLVSPELSDKPRLVEGSLNTFVTSGGKISKRPGVSDLDATLTTLPANRKVIRLWDYAPPVGGTRWLLMSALKSGGGYEMYYRRIGSGYSWTSFGSVRQMNNSQTPHECIVQNGVAYIRGTPSAVSGEKYSTVSFRVDSSAAVKIRWWGLPSPQTPARLSGHTTFIAADVAPADTVINVTSNFSPALTAPFKIQIDNERMTVTSTGAGTNWSVTRGVDGTAAATHIVQNGRVNYFDWTTSAHRVNIWSYWRYTYAWVNEFGHISNRAPGETNPDLMQSDTGAFFDLCPKVKVQGNADTTNVPKINVYRTQDGGGTYYFVGDVVNTGAGDITFEDRLLETGPTYATTQDPIPDNLLDTFNISPDLDSNTVPPTVVSPLVIGTDTPETSTPLASYASRIWYGIRNVLFYSGNEEIAEGIPEESWPAGIDGNYFRFQHNIVALAASEAALYVFTTEHTYKVTGSDLLTLNIAPLYHNIGAYSPTAVTRMGRNVAFLTHDKRVAVIAENDKLSFISEPLGNSWSAAGTSGEFTFVYWGEKDRDLLFVFYYEAGKSKTFVYDGKLSEVIKDSFWHAPWDIEARTALATKYEGTARVLLIGQEDGIRKIAFDESWKDGASGYDWIARSGLQLVPAGNHVNDLRVSALTPVVVRTMIERTKFPGDRNPHVTFAFDDFWTAETPAVSVHPPTSHAETKWYESLLAEADQAAFRVGISLAVHNSVTPVELQTLITTWAPDSGAMT